MIDVPSSVQNEPLRDARRTEALGDYIRGVWVRRDYIAYVAASEMRSRQINSVLGNLWHVLNPMLQIGVFYVIFGLVLEVDRGVDNFVGFLAIGIFVYTYTQRAVMAGGRSMLKYRKLIQILMFPRAMIPLTSSVTEALAILPAYLVMFVVAAATGEQPTLSWLLMIPLFAVQSVFNVGASLIAARAVSRFFDIQQVLPFVFRLGFYASGVLFNVNAYLEDRPTARVLFELNPLYCFIELARGFVLNGSGPDWSLAVTAAVWTVGIALFGLVWFRRAEDTYGED